MSNNTGFFSFLKQSIPTAIWAIGVSSLLMNMATSVMFSGTALYMKTVLGVGVSTIGMLEAVVEAIAYSIRIFSGVASDFLRKRKSVMLFGFILLTIAKPLLAFSRTVFQIFVARALDRVGNGIQASPRDALISDISPKENKGACYGLRQSLSVVGSTLGGVFGIVVMKATSNDFEMMFLLASIPAIIAVIMIIYFVKDVKESHELRDQKKKRPISTKDLKALGGKFWILMLIVSVFMLGRFSEIFISLNACGVHGLNVAYGTLITVIYNLASTMISYPAGKLSDRIDRTTILFIGFILLFISHVTIYAAPNIIFVIIGTLFWGLQVGISQSIFSTLVSDYVPKDLRGTGFGVFYFITAIFTAIASMFAGAVSESSGTEATAFFYGAIFCSFAIVMLLSCKRKLAK